MDLQEDSKAQEETTEFSEPITQTNTNLEHHYAEVYEADQYGEDQPLSKLEQKESKE